MLKDIKIASVVQKLQFFGCKMKRKKDYIFCSTVFYQSMIKDIYEKVIKAICSQNLNLVQKRDKTFLR